MMSEKRQHTTTTTTTLPAPVTERPVKLIPVYPVNSDVVERWIAILADKIGRPLSRPTATEYLRAFDEANITDRGLDRAFRDLFREEMEYPKWPSPDHIIARARRAESDMRREEREAATAGKGDTEVEPERPEPGWMMYAREWARRRRARYRAVRRRIERQVCHRARVGSVDELNVWQKEMLAGEIATACYTQCLREEVRHFRARVNMEDVTDATTEDGGV